MAMRGEDALVIDEGVRELVRLAVREDLGSGEGGGDVTVRLGIPEALRGEGRIVPRREGVICGTVLLGEILRAYGLREGEVDVGIKTADGQRVGRGETVAVLRGSVGRILTAERVILNFLGHLSGVATVTRRYVDLVARVKTASGRSPVICDTRKTTPGFRVLDKYAVRCGGGVNDRMGLYDGVMLKDNHLAALREKYGAGLSLGELTGRIRGELPGGILVWLEVDTLEQLAEELRGEGKGADIVIVDNFSTEMMREAVRMREGGGRARRRPLLEASGGITEETVAAVAETGVDRLSIGALTHSSGVLDVSMDWGRS
ncbi:MAG TPA: carboxylating nicotinate-nucleotide diphosphorylase [Phycisphaerae bacterium]|nr:carboxylating nicotinate-nucleotide diphosphorylase [Phycisphaerae bacterium]